MKSNSYVIEGTSSKRTSKTDYNLISENKYVILSVQNKSHL